MNTDITPEVITPTILIVEDEVPIRMGLSAAIRRKGYRVITAENGNDALAKAGENLPDLIISDIMMPVLDGFEMKQKLNADPALSSIPVIYLTARTSIEDRVAGLRGGADDYLNKPFDAEELTARIEAVLRRVQREHKLKEEQALKKVEELEKLRNELIQNFHHELRTPLNNMMMFLEIVAAHKFETPEEQEAFLRSARTSGDRLESLVSDLVLLTDIEQGILNHIRQPISPELHLLEPIYRRLPRYEAREVSLMPIISVQNEIKAPRSEFPRAVLHLVDNALKFSPLGGMVLVKVNGTLNGGAVITIEDQGPGIPVELREKVFERYYQISQGAARSYEGLGLGLTLARAVFRSLGGDVCIIESAQGCCVQATLPDVGPDDIVYG